MDILKHEGKDALFKNFFKKSAEIEKSTVAVIYRYSGRKEF